MISQAIFRKFCLLLLALEGCECKRNWDYDPISLTGHSSDETKLKPDLRVEHVGRYEAGFSGTLDWQYDVDYTTMIEVEIFRSASGSESDYMRLPFAVPKRTLLNSKAEYDNLLYPNTKRCSNMPRFEGDILHPWPRNLYKFHMCDFKNGIWPEILVDGFYKVKIIVTGEVDWSLTFVVRISSTLF
ncbi:uncharacterized protein LOC115761613 [Drosophila novamexicana]|uniref:uncharacterized protein LOC115761613 n=1 Tax=Drosophila novamexicana TaxID=47314 RepID=UPI0011E5BEDE|nr:uncharacterized protein LOC115761613 [Drosophila novamexicana]